MKLEMDIGNSFVKWRLFKLNGDSIDKGSFETNNESITPFSARPFIPCVTEVLISNVSSSEFEQRICQIFEQSSSGCSVFVARVEKEMCGISFAYEHYDRLGVDRCLVMIAAFRRCSQGVLVIDCGSAVTADIVMDTGEHIGGFIMPGYNLLKKSLLEGTSRVSADNARSREISPGKNTESCVESGVNLMLKSAMQGLIACAKKNNVQNVVFTGGDGKFVHEIVGKGEYFADLVFEGLRLVSSYGKLKQV